MYSRFLDNKNLIEKESGFVKRSYGLRSSWLVLSFICSYLIIAYLTYYFTSSTSLIFYGLIGLVIALLTIICCYFFSHTSHIINLLELQTSLFAGIAKTSSEFCMIIKYDGTVVYVDPQYNNSFFRLKNNGLSDFNALCESGALTKDMRDKLLRFLESGESGSIEFTSYIGEKETELLTLSVDPIGIYNPEELNRRFYLTIAPITRPSGYFFLRMQKTNLNDNHYDFLDSLGLAYFSINEKENIIFANQNFYTITGYNRDDLFTKKLDYRNIFVDPVIIKKINSSNNFTELTQLKCKNNSYKSAFILSTVINHSSNKSTTYFIIFETNLTNIKNTSPLEIALDKSNIIETSPLPSFVLNKNGDFINYNDAFRKIISNIKISNISTENPFNITNLTIKGDPSNLKELLNNIASNNSSNIRVIDLHLLKNNNEELIVSVYLKPISDNDNNITITGHLIDLTELKNLESKLVHSQKMQAVGQLAGGIAHDFNNLLTAMSGFCDLLLLKHPAGDTSFPDIMQIKQNANRAANLVKQLLAFSRKQTLQPKIINITDTLSDLSSLIRRLIGENITLKINHGRNVNYTKVDQGQLEQVIINLAVNARDAISGHGILTINTSVINIDDNNKFITKEMFNPTEDEIVENGEYLLIEVSDNGKGMDHSLIEKVFEPFFSTKKTGQGTGLGLSTVYGIIKQTSGYIFVKSTENIGTTFYILLKHYNKNNEETSNIQAEEEVTKLDNDNIDLTGRGTILLVEDEAPVRTFSASALTHKGYNVIQADCAAAALEIIKNPEYKINLIITDVVMPGMNGPTMIEEIIKTHPDIKVIFVSGYGEDEFMKHYGQERKFNFLSKPYSLKQLALKVKQTLEEK